MIQRNIKLKRERRRADFWRLICNPEEQKVVQMNPLTVMDCILKGKCTKFSLFSSQITQAGVQISPQKTPCSASTCDITLSNESNEV